MDSELLERIAKAGERQAAAREQEAEATERFMRAAVVSHEASASAHAAVEQRQLQLMEMDAVKLPWWRRMFFR